MSDFSYKCILYFANEKQKIFLLSTRVNKEALFCHLPHKRVRLGFEIASILFSQQLSKSSLPRLFLFIYISQDPWCIIPLITEARGTETWMDRVSTAAVSHGRERQGGRERHDRIFVTFDLTDCKTHNWRLGVIEREKKFAFFLKSPFSSSWHSLKLCAAFWGWHSVAVYCLRCALRIHKKNKIKILSLIQQEPKQPGTVCFVRHKYTWQCCDKVKHQQHKQLH